MPFSRAYQAFEIPLFNRPAEQGTVLMVGGQCKYAATERLMVLAVKDETYGAGTLTRIGFVAAHFKGPERHLLVYVDTRTPL